MTNGLIRELENRLDKCNGYKIPMYVTEKEMRSIITALKVYNAFEEVLDSEIERKLNER